MHWKVIKVLSKVTEEDNKSCSTHWKGPWSHFILWGVCTYQICEFIHLQVIAYNEMSSIQGTTKYVIRFFKLYLQKKR